jgi:hypothetical protein
MKAEHISRIKASLQATYISKLASIIDVFSKYNSEFKDYAKFAKFIGYPEEPNSFNWIVNIDNPEIKKIIDMIYDHPEIIPALAGPHGATMLKVLLIQNEEIVSGKND